MTSSKKYEGVIFDLDRTLWDFDKNSEVMIAQLFDHHELTKKGVPSLAAFMEKYIEINDRLWAQINKGSITKEQLRDARFYETLLHFGIDSRKTAKKFGMDYIEHCPKQPHLIEGTIEILNYLKDKYRLGIITNGFIQTQWTKLKTTGLKPYFEVVTIAEQVGVHKPHPKIFQSALAEFGPKSKAQDFLMIGDHWEGDIEGAKKFGMDQVYFNLKKENRLEECTHKIEHLLALKDIL